MRIILLLLLIIPATFLKAQKQILVVDKLSMEILPDVKVSSNNIVTSTDKNGYFDLNRFLSLGLNDSLSFSRIGYFIEKISFAHLQRGVDTVYIKQKEEALNELVIQGFHQQPFKEVPYIELSKMKNGVFAFAAILLDDKIYAIGGDESIRNETMRYSEWASNNKGCQIYDIKANEWKLSDIGFSKRTHHNAHYLNGKIFVLGGKYIDKNPDVELLNPSIEVYDFGKDTLISSDTNIHPAINFASAVYGNNIFMMGGSTKLDRYSNLSYTLDAISGYWYELDNLDTRMETRAITVNDNIYLIGGFNSKYMYYITEYNPQTGIYKKIVDVDISWKRPALAHNDNIIYIFEDDVLVTFDVEAKSISYYSLPLHLYNSEIVCDKNNLYIIGGKTIESRGDNVKILNEKVEVEINIGRPSNKLYKIDLKDLRRTQVSTSL